MARQKDIIQEVRLKNGQNAGWIKQSDGGVFLSLKTISNFTVYLLIFILLLSITLAIVEVNFIADGFNKIITGMKIMDQRIGLLIDNQTALLTPSYEHT